MSKILVADDSLFMRKMLKDILAKGGHNTVIEAQDGVEALRILKSKENPDLILLDIIMPNVDGIETLKKMDKATIPKVIVVSAVGQEKMKQQASKLGVKYYVVKPFKGEEVLRLVNKALGVLKKQ